MSRIIDHLVIHCSATPNGRPVTSEQIDDWHRQRGFKRTAKLIGFNEPTLRHIGYHHVIYVDGSVRIGRGENEVGAHVQGFNAHSIGICMVGTSEFTRAQWASLKGLIEGLQRRYKTALVRGHRDFSPDQNRNGEVEPFEWLKTCPGFDVSTWLRGGMEPLKGHLLENI